MGWFRRKTDPISQRERALNSEIAALEGQIKTLSAQLEKKQAQPRLRSTAMPHAATISRESMPNEAEPVAPTSPGPRTEEPIFEEVDQDPLHGRSDGNNTPEHYNDLGVRKYDLPALLRRWQNHFRAPSTTNPKLVSYLAAGGIQGLRPLRYEKRVARNRFILLVVVLFLLLLGLLGAFLRHR